MQPPQKVWPQFVSKPSLVSPRHIKQSLSTVLVLPDEEDNDMGSALGLGDFSCRHRYPMLKITIATRR